MFTFRRSIYFLLCFFAVIWCASCSVQMNRLARSISRSVHPSDSPKFLLFKNSAFVYPPQSRIKLYLNNEQDLAGGYFDRIQAYEINSLREELTTVLQQPKIPYYVVEYDNSGYKGTIDNFFEVVDDSMDADISISLVIEAFGYKDKDTIEEIFKRWSWWGALGVLSGSDPHGYISVSCFAREKKTGKILHSFNGNGVSEPNKPNRDALSEAIPRGAYDLVRDMLKANP